MSLHLWATIGAAIVGVVTMVGFAIADHLERSRQRQLLYHQTPGPRPRQHVGQLRVTDTNDYRCMQFANSSASSVYSDEYLSARDSSICSDEYFSARGSSIIGSIEEEETPSKAASPMSEMDANLRDIDKRLEHPVQVRYAFDALRELLLRHPNEAKVLWRMGEAHFHKSVAASVIVDKLKCINTGLEYCRRALAVAPKSGDAHKWYAILVGARCKQHESIADRMRDGADFKTHIESAIELLPKDALVHYVFGRYAMEIAGLSWFERTAASTVCGVPNYSYDDALNSFRTANRFCKKDWKMNLLCIGKCYAALGNCYEAITWLDAANEASSEYMLEEGAKGEIDTLVWKYAVYRRRR